MMENTEMGGTLSIISSIGFAVWFGFYMTTRVIPRFNETVKDITKEFREELRAEREQNRNDLREFWDSHRKETGALTEAIREQTNELRMARHSGRLPNGGHKNGA